MTTYSIQSVIPLTEHTTETLDRQEALSLQTTPERSTRILEALRTHTLYTSSFLFGKKISPLLEKDIRDISPEQLYQTLEKFLKETQSETKELQSLLKELSHIIPMEKLQDAIRTTYKDHRDALTTAKAMLQEALYFIEKTKDTPPSIKERVKSFISTILSTMETMISVFGIAGFFKPPESEYDADGKFQRILSLVNFFSLLSAALIPIIGVTAGGLMIGAALLLIAIISLTYPYFQPTPALLPKAENWTTQYRNHKLEEIGGRQATVQAIADTLSSSQGIKTHPMLIGPSGVGKTQTVKALVRAIEQGSYPELKGKKVFYINTADIINGKDFLNGENRILSKLSRAMGRHRENIILVFDEIHLACRSKESSDISEQLKTLLDSGHDKFPHVIGITTEEEFYRDIYSKNPAFARRFKKITINNTDPEETEHILNDFLLHESKECLVKPGILKAIIEKTKAAFSSSEPASSLRILSQCVQRTTESQKSVLQCKVDLAKEKITSIRSQKASMTGSSLLPYSQDQKREALLEEELQKLESQLAEENKKICHLFHLKEELCQTKEKLFKTVSKISQLQKEHLSKKDSEKLNQFLLISHLLLPSLEKKVRTEAEAQGIRIEITEELIDEVIQEEKENEAKATLAIERGKEHIQALT
jgi:ATP-dependent Clp protease ATP-binding subunit ClpA